MKQILWPRKEAVGYSIVQALTERFLTQLWDVSTTMRIIKKEKKNRGLIFHTWFQKSWGDWKRLQTTQFILFRGQKEIGKMKEIISQVV